MNNFNEQSVSVFIKHTLRIFALVFINSAVNSACVSFIHQPELPECAKDGDNFRWRG